MFCAHLASAGGGAARRSAGEEALLRRLYSESESVRDSVELEEVLAVIDGAYEHSPAGFTNGRLRNGPGENAKSAKLLAWALVVELGTKDTLRCFGRAYRELEPAGGGHPNIRELMAHGIKAVRFDTHTLRRRGGDDE